MRERLIVIALTLMDLALCGALLCTLRKALHALKWMTFTVAVTLTGYMVMSGLLFWMDRFSIAKALAAEGAACAVALVVRLALAHSRGTGLAKLDWNFRAQAIPVALAMLALILSSGNNGFFGMGQDQGVYQTKAIDLMYGKTEKVYRFDEYKKLETESEKQLFYDGVINRLIGLNNIGTYSEENAFSHKLTGQKVLYDEVTDGIYHGIPTYPAVLALFGMIAGLEYMTGVQTLLFMLTALVLWFIGENMGLKKIVGVLMCLIYVLSPEALWLSKSTLTESYLALTMAMFLYFLSEREHPENRWWSAWMVTVFSVLHVSIYVMIPMFLVTYYVLYLYSEDRQYLRAAAISSVSFIAGFTMMTVVAPRYTIRNTQQIWVGPIRLGNVYFILMAVGAVGIALAFALRLTRPGGRVRAFMQSKAFEWVCRGAVTALLAASALITLKNAASGIDLKAAFVQNGLYNMIWMTGVVSLPFIIAYMLVAPAKLFRNETETAFTLVFGYAVLIMCCLLKSRIEYCYYCGRYLTPYIPVVCVMAGMLWNRFSSRKTCAVAMMSAAIMLPFDTALMVYQDDTVSSFNAVLRIAEAVRGDNNAVLFDFDHEYAFDALIMFYMPVRAMSGADCYFAGEDVDGQMQKLYDSYDQVYYVTTREANYDVVLRISEVFSLDDNQSYRPPLCPFPYKINTSRRNYTVYQYAYSQTFRHESQGLQYENLYTNGGEIIDGQIVLSNGDLQYGPYITLESGRYRVDYTGENLDRGDIWVTRDKGADLLSITMLKQDAQSLSYEFTADVLSGNVELLMNNNTDTPIKIEQLKIKQIR